MAFDMPSTLHEHGDRGRFHATLEALCERLPDVPAMRATAWGASVTPWPLANESYESIPRKATGSIWPYS